MKTKSYDRERIDRWLVAHKIGQITVSVRYNRRLDVYRAFLCSYWQGGNILEFNTAHDSGLRVRVISTKEGKEEEMLVIETPPESATEDQK